MRPQAIVAVLAIAAAGVGGGVLLERQYLAADAASPATSQNKKVLYWWDPMIPDYKSDKPGKSPMGMDMVPVYEDEEPGASGEPAGTVAVSPATLQNLGVRTAEANLTTLTPTLRTFGTVGFDESRTSDIHVRAEGWIERLHKRVEGETVARGELLFEFFSPNLASAAYEYVRELERGSLDGIQGARRKLAALGVSDRQVEEIRKSRQVPELVKVYAHQDGVITSLGVSEGMFIQPDMTLMTVTDLSTVWVMAEVFESQAALVRPGMAAEIAIKGLPGRTWTGAVDYVYPDLRQDTRTVRLRIPLDNRDGVLRPNMFASIRLVPEASKQVVAVPQEAVIRTGSGNRVVVSLGDGRFKPVFVETGLAADGLVEVTKGVEPGTPVVTSAHFLFDSEANLSGALAKLQEPEADPAPPATAEGIVLAVNEAEGKLTIQHGPIDALGWPAMTMDFAVDPATLPEGISEGSSIRFDVSQAADGAYRAGDISLAHGDHQAHAGLDDASAAAPASSEPVAWTDATVESPPVEGKVTLAHPPIPEIGWPAMTMEFALDPAVDTTRLTPGSRARVGLAEDGAGGYRVIAVQRTGGPS
ncbi:efflux RND transporter periplasmic adaptor subunit [Indioceanicola profundi]|uniref:efflux RND transporter periplasmic adaptor subunit n=1 Tax=Indioceanicola profundi TaxID=2220096 RepID=UPI0013C4755B|nr:efflux RND transporter periplasmic adaptor subunit [Indioceanicola profundi]